MFKYSLKLFLTIFLFSNFLYSDGADIQISVSNATAVNENAGITSFTVSLSEEADFCNVVDVAYTTIDNSATSSLDYVSKSGTLTFYGECDSPSRVASSINQTVSVTILDDASYELTENFYLNLSNATTGYTLSDSSGYAYIYDDDTQPLELNSFADKGVTETDTDQVLSMVANFNQNIPAGLTLTYHTEDDTALAGTDYISASGTINVPINSNNVLIPITIKGDIIPESMKRFKIIIDSISAGTITDNVASAFINDDDAIKVDISSSDVLEGNSGDSNQMEFKIFLGKDYPSATPLTINYTTQDGSSPSATVGSDYTLTTGSVTFNMGDREKIVYVPIIGDDTIESDENLKMIISGSTYIIDSDSEAEILNDDGNYPSIDFSTADLSIIEGNSSTKTLNFHFTLDADAIAETSFEYYTQDDDAKVSDNDYVAISTTTYDIPIGTRDIDIAVTINGDTNIEEDETFYLKFQSENNLVIHGHTAKGNIINDDGSYPELTFDLSSYSIVEGNSGKKNLNITLQLDQAALPGSSFDYYTEDDSAQVSNNDYKKINNKTHTFVGGELTLTIPVKIKGDTNVENNEEFYFKIFNASDNLKLSSSVISSKGEILNDDGATSSSITNVGEFRFDDCGNDEWKVDHSSLGNNASNGTPSIISNDGKTYMCTSLNGLSGVATIPHNAAYALDEGTFSMLLYDHHNIWSSNSWMFQKGAFKVEVIRAGGNANQGSIKVHLDGNIIDTQEVFFTNSDGDDLDTQWIHVSITFGTSGMKLYINGIEKGTHPYTGGISAITDDFSLATLSGYYDEFYIFEGQMSDIQVDQMYQNTINDKNLDGSDRDCGCYIPSDPFTCDSSMYISSSTNRETSATRRMWLHRIDTTQNPFEFEVMEDTGATELYNATAYNPDDNYIYGLYHRELVRLSRSAEVTNLGTITALPNRFNSKQLYAGAIHGGFYYVSGRNSLSDKLFRIKLSDLSVTKVTLSEGVALQDFSFYKNVNDAIPEGQFLYGVEKDGKLTKIDLSNGAVTRIGSDHNGYEFDSSFSDKNGRFFANDSNGNGFFEFDLATGTRNLISNSQSATFNDGANCINAALVFNDFGDAPASYGTPKHNLANGVFMGDTIDHDIYTFNSINAEGDDLDGIDDEDGLTLADGSDLNGAFLALNATHDLKIKVLKAGYLNAWIDYNIDGDFNDAGEKIFTGLSLTAGTHTISINIPNGLISNSTTYMRFRYASTANLNAIENANDGEVEDYAIKFGSDGIKGKFNIQRTNSALNANDYALYTQIVGRKFNYHIVFYDELMTTEQELEKVPLKIELIDVNNPTATPMYTSYNYFSHTLPSTRIPVINDNDLSLLPATKEALFKITYAIDGSDSIVQQECNTDYRTCFETLMNANSLDRSNDAEDKFAIRPESFFISVSDGNVERVNSNYPNNTLRMAAGYDYNLTFIATQHSNTLPSNGYDMNFNEMFDFNSSNITTCADTSDINHNINFNDGLYTDANFTHDNVGNYTLLIHEDNNWTAVDQNGIDCISNQSFSSGNGDTVSGCNIKLQQNPINLEFYPDHFDIDLTMRNLPSSGHVDFLYMSELNATYNNVAVQFDGKITAQTENNTPTTNFTVGCVAQTVTLDLNATTISVEGTNQAIFTSEGTPVNFTRWLRFNDDNNLTLINNALANVAGSFDLTSNRFLNENNGTAFLDARYNVNKHLTEPINPVEVTFNSINAISATSNSVAHNIDPYTPRGSQTYIDNIKNFYFARVVSDLNNYPRTNITISPLVRTPLNVDIYCQTNVADYCLDRRVNANTRLTGTTREAHGWYLSANHNGELDGNVTNLVANPPIVNIDPDSDLDPTINNIPLPNGENGLIMETFINCANPSSTITIETSPVLAFLPSQYIVNCTDVNASQWSGIGETGNILNIKSKVNPSRKMDW